MSRQLKTALSAGFVALALLAPAFDGVPVVQAQKAPDTSVLLSTRFPSFSFPKATLVFGKVANVKATFADP